MIRVVTYRKFGWLSVTVWFGQHVQPEPWKLDSRSGMVDLARAPGDRLARLRVKLPRRSA